MESATMTQNGATKPCAPVADFEATLRGWLRVASRHSRHDLLEEDFAIYAELLSDLDAKTLDAAYKQALKTCKFFPTAAEVLAHVERADSVAEELSAESAWARALKWCIANGNVPGTPRPIGEPAIEVAIRAAGGGDLITADKHGQGRRGREAVFGHF